MTVQELIDALQKLPPEAMSMTVIFEDIEENENEIANPRIYKYRRYVQDGKWVYPPPVVRLD